MDVLKDILIPLLVSIAGSFATIGIVFIFSTRIKRTLYRLCARLMRIDLEQTFVGRSSAHEDMGYEITRAQTVFLLTGRGQELQTEMFSLLLADRPRSRNCDFRILLPNTEPTDGTDWTDVNDKMMSKMDPAYGSGLLKQQITMTVTVLEEYRQKYDHLEVRRFNMPHIGRIIVTENCAYFNPYNEMFHARHNHIFKFYAGGPMYNVLKRLFILLWNNQSSTARSLSKLLPSPASGVAAGEN